MILVTLNGMVPASLSVQALEKTDMKELEQPIISKDVDGEESKEIQLETDYHYNINIQLPEDVTGYEFIEISDDFDKWLAVQNTAVLIGEEVDDRFRATVDGQKVSLELKDEQIKEFAGKELTLQITAQVKEEDATEEAIENVAQFAINNNIILETNSAIVIPVDLEKEEQEADLSVESEEKDQKTPNEATEEEKDNEPEVKVEAVEKDVQDIQTNDQASAKKESIAPLNLVQAADGITINDTDSYSITNIDGEKYIIQYDGANPSAPPKGKVKLDNANINNSLALGKNEDVFYANAGANLYRIHPNGKTELVTSLEGNTLAGAISPDGTKYVYFLLKNGQIYISSVDLVTKEKNSVPIQDKSGFASFAGGDLAFDADGNLWFSRWSDAPITSVLAKVDVEKGVLESVIPIVSDNGKNFTRSGALSFLPNGKFLLLGAYEIVSDINANVFYLFELDPATGIATELTENYTGTTDFASRVYPSIKPDLVIEKRNDPSDEVFPGDTITYTLKVTNTGTLA